MKENVEQARMTAHHGQQPGGDQQRVDESPHHLHGFKNCFETVTVGGDCVALLNAYLSQQVEIAVSHKLEHEGRNETVLSSQTLPYLLQWLHSLP